MMDFFFFVKTFALTVLIVLLMQIQVGGKSVESHALGWVQSSAVVSPLNSVAGGGAKLVRDVTRAVSASLRGKNNQATKAKKDDKKSSFRWLWDGKNQEADAGTPAN